MIRKTLFAIGAIASSFLAAGAANAALVINATESAGDVVFSYTGNIDLTGLTLLGQINETRNFAGPDAGVFFSSGAGQLADLYDGGPLPSFGTGNISNGVGAGDVLNISSNNVFGIPAGYVSGSLINGSLTVAGATFASLGLFDGTFTSTLSNGDTISMVIGAVGDPVPLPAAAFLFAPALGLIAARRRRKA